MKTKHTPGPWTCGGQVVYAENKRTIAIFPDEECPALWNGGTHGGGFECSDCACREQEENAKLAAAAPELLAALQALVKRCAALDQSVTHDGIDNCYAIAKAGEAIQKAQGEA